MDDSISRQAVINTVFSMFCRWDTEDPDDLKNMLLLAFQELPTASRWIPCRERLPKYGKTVLITNAKGNVSYGRFRGVEFWREDGDNFWQWKKNTIEHVLAWMPLPEPYKEEENAVD